MGQTKSDRNRLMYLNYIKKGFTHSQAIKRFPKYMRKQVVADLEKSSIESHFGVKPLTFLLMLLGILIVGLILIIIM